MKQGLAFLGVLAAVPACVDSSSNHQPLDDDAVAPVVTYEGTLAMVGPMIFDGDPSCIYTVTISDIRATIMVRTADHRVQYGSMIVVNATRRSIPPCSLRVDPTGAALSSNSSGTFSNGPEGYLMEADMTLQPIDDGYVATVNFSHPVPSADNWSGVSGVIKLAPQ